MSRQVIAVALIIMSVVGAYAVDTKAPASSLSTSPSSSPTGSPSDAPDSSIGIEVPNDDPTEEPSTEGPSAEVTADYGGGDAPAPGPDAAEGEAPPTDTTA
ncbi:classical arabinogalactan protein 11-like [Hibiscus syriacus]|uniref:classical arabinogalactan protein 11-like n=1 Tax=Hibiscus syriacus TaxID=106335 RepID=UPI00192075A6|nr:classical arabinogalactan protein 11-like [Hibiscus syriacus]